MGLIVVVATQPVHALDAGPGRPAFPPGRTTRVLVLGDSVPLGAATQIPAALGQREAVVDAAVNRTTGEGSAVLDQVGTDWDVVVVMLGHNDGGSPGVFQPAARRLLDQLRDVPRVVWLSIHEVRDYYPAVNQFVAGLTPDYPNLRIADWHTVASTNPGSTASDGLHLTPAGADRMAELVTGAVVAAELEYIAVLRALAPPPTTTTTTTAPPTTTTTAPPTTTTTEPPTTAAPTTTTTAAPTTLDASDQPPGATSSDAGGTDERGDATTALALGGVAVAAGIGAAAVRRRRARAATP